MSPKDPNPPPMPERLCVGADVYIRTHEQLLAAGAEFEHWDDDWIGYQRVGRDGILDHAIHHKYDGTKQRIKQVNHKEKIIDFHLEGIDYLWPAWAFMDIDDRIERLKTTAESKIAHHIRRQNGKSTMQTPRYMCPACDAELTRPLDTYVWKCEKCTTTFEVRLSEDCLHLTVGQQLTIGVGDGLAGGALGEEPTCDEDPSGIEKEKHVVHFKLDTPNSQAACGCWGHYVFVAAISAVTCDACIVALEASGRVINLVKHVDSLDAANKLGPMETELQQEPDEKLPWDEFKKDCPHCNKRMLAFIERDRLAKPLECSLHQTGDGRPVFRQMYNTSDYLVLHHMCHSCGHSEAERQYDDGRREEITC